MYFNKFYLDVNINIIFVVKYGLESIYRLILFKKKDLHLFDCITTYSAPEIRNFSTKRVHRDFPIPSGNSIRPLGKLIPNIY
jgi:hypothetical protein